MLQLPLARVYLGVLACRGCYLREVVSENRAIHCAPCTYRERSGVSSYTPMRLKISKLTTLCAAVGQKPASVNKLLKHWSTTPTWRLCSLACG